MDEGALNFICEHGYDVVFGARPLKRAITQYLENPLAESMLSGKVKAHVPIVASVVDGRICLENQT